MPFLKKEPHHLFATIRKADHPSKDGQTSGGVFMNKRLSEFDDVCGLLTLGALSDIKRYQLAFGQRFKTLALKRREMDEYVLFPALGGNKSIAFLVAKPLDSSLCHDVFLSVLLGE